MIKERYLLEREDNIEKGVMDFLTTETGLLLANSLWQCLNVVSSQRLFLTGIPKHILIGRLPKNNPLYHKVQPDSDVDIICITCEFNLTPEEFRACIEAEATAHPNCHPSWWYEATETKLLAKGSIVWPPELKHLSAVEVKSAYSLTETRKGKPSVMLYGLTNKKLNKAETQCKSLLLMGFDWVSMLVGIATEPQGGIGSQPWMNASTVGAEAFFKAKPSLESLPDAEFGIAAWPIGAIGGPLSFVPRNRILKGKHPLKIDPTKTVLLRKTEKYAGAGCAQLIRPALKNSRINRSNIRNLRDGMFSKLADILRGVPKPILFPAILSWDKKKKALVPILGFPTISHTASKRVI